MVARRPGHSLPELIVAITLLATTLAGAASTAVLGSRWTTDAVTRQEALAVVAATLDSLTAVPAPPDSGSLEVASPRLVVRWAVDMRPDSLGGELEVRVSRGPEEPALVAIQGFWLAPLGELP